LSDWRVMLVTKPSLGTLAPPGEPTALNSRNRTAWAGAANLRLSRRAGRGASNRRATSDLPGSAYRSGSWPSPGGSLPTWWPYPTRSRRRARRGRRFCPPSGHAQPETPSPGEMPVSTVEGVSAIEQIGRFCRRPLPAMPLMPARWAARAEDSRSGRTCTWIRAEPTVRRLRCRPRMTAAGLGRITPPRDPRL
jgi:hypothetical protein